MDNFSGLPCAKMHKQTMLNSLVALTYVVSGIAGVFDKNASSQEYFFYVFISCMFFQLDILQMSTDMFDTFRQNTPPAVKLKTWLAQDYTTISAWLI